VSGIITCVAFLQIV